MNVEIIKKYKALLVPGTLSKEFSDLATERRAAYARFQELGK